MRILRAASGGLLRRLASGQVGDGSCTEIDRHSQLGSQEPNANPEQLLEQLAQSLLDADGRAVRRRAVRAVTQLVK